MDNLTVKIEKLSPKGEGVGLAGKRKAFVYGAFPGETVAVRPYKQKRSSLDCELVKVIEPLPERIEPAEDHYLTCSPWQGISLDKELALKKQLLRDIFNGELPEFELVSLDQFHYRNKLEFSFTGDIELAFFKRGSFRIKTPLNGCQLGLAPLNQAARQVRDGLKNLGVKAEQLKALVLRSNLAGELLGSLYVFSEEIEVNKIIEVVGKIEEIKGFKVAFSTPLSPTNTPTKALAAYGEESIEENVLGKRLKFSDSSFFQANIPIFEKAVEDIKNYVNAKDKLYDIYCGVGTIGIAIGLPGIKMIETEPESVKYARLNCRLNGWDESAVAAGKAEDWLGEIEPGATVIFDPPRPGFHPKIFKALAARPPQRIIYLSCNPAAQARDIKELGSRYKLVFFKAYNFFPRTPHIETLAVLDKQ